ncbi:transposase InsO family protein [Methylobacterium sp. PvR107]|nr:transposase InsO family protein [Methylobacterium sp. PvR107]
MAKTRRHPCPGGARVQALHDRQPPRPPDRAQSPEARLLGRAAQHGLAGRTEGLRTDITDLPPGEGWLYLDAVLDLATRKIVGWSMRDHMRAELSVAALLMAAQRQRPTAGLICHSDRGSQYAAEAYQKQLVAMGRGRL